MTRRRRSRVVLGAAVLALGSNACEAVAGLFGERSLAVEGAAGRGGMTSDAGHAGGGAPSGGQSGGAQVPAGFGGSPSEVMGIAGEGGAGNGEGGAGGQGIAGEAGAGEAGVSAGQAGEPPAPPATSCSEPLACAGGDSCATRYVPGGTLEMGRSTNGSDAYASGDSGEQPEHAVMVSPFWLDKYEVTVGRFRRFADAYSADAIPAVGDGANPHIPSSGWKQEWNAYMPADAEALQTAMIIKDPNCDPTYRTWTPAEGMSECLPINCVSFYLAFAFCIWDGGRLPTEAEWEFAAAGGEKNRLYPWGPEAPTADRAIFDCSATGDSDCTPADIRPIGSTSAAGYGLFGQADLAGSMLEMTRDVMDPTFYTLASASDPNPANLSGDTGNAALASVRGGSFASPAGAIRAVIRESMPRSYRHEGVGLRCARNP